VAQYRNKFQKHGLEERVIFTGQVLPQEVNSYIRCADMLVSPRISGTNTPLKIYAYLRSGVPIVATRLLTHTQVLSDDVAVLTEPTAEAFAEGIVEILSDKKKARRLGDNARRLSQERYGYPLYRQKLEDTMMLALKRGV
jgi:glycosyltransferase involved in cell wall biosynthesis